MAHHPGLDAPTPWLGYRDNRSWMAHHPSLDAPIPWLGYRNNRSWMAHHPSLDAPIPWLGCRDNRSWMAHHPSLDTPIPWLGETHILPRIYQIRPRNREIRSRKREIRPLKARKRPPNPENHPETPEITALSGFCSPAFRRPISWSPSPKPSCLIVSNSPCLPVLPSVSSPAWVGKIPHGTPSIQPTHRLHRHWGSFIRHSAFRFLHFIGPGAALHPPRSADCPARQRNASKRSLTAGRERSEGQHGRLRPRQWQHVLQPVRRRRHPRPATVGNWQPGTQYSAVTTLDGHANIY